MFIKSYYKKLTVKEYMDLMTPEMQKVFLRSPQEVIDVFYTPHEMGGYEVLIDDTPLMQEDLPDYYQGSMACCDGPFYRIFDPGNTTIVPLYGCQHFLVEVPRGTSDRKESCEA